MNKLAIFAVAMAAGIASSAMAAPVGSDGLKRLAETGWADVAADEGRGMAFDEIGGKPGMFEYSEDFSASDRAAVALLEENEFLAPHWLRGFDGKDYIMVAPHLFVDGVLMKGANEHKDHFIVVDRATGEAVRYDYSDDVKGMMM